MCQKEEEQLFRRKKKEGKMHRLSPLQGWFKIQLDSHGGGTVASHRIQLMFCSRGKFQVPRIWQSHASRVGERRSGRRLATWKLPRSNCPKVRSEDGKSVGRLVKLRFQSAPPADAVEYRHSQSEHCSSSLPVSQSPPPPSTGSPIYPYLIRPQRRRTQCD